MTRSMPHRLRTLWVLVPLMACVTGCGLFGPRIPDPVVPELVTVDGSMDAYTVFTAQPLKLSPAELGEVKAQAEHHAGVELMLWSDFLAQREELFDACMVEDDYPGSQARTGLLELLRRYPGVPFGLTWNGGIAFTFQDYQYAKRTWEIHGADPDAMSAGGTYMPDQDPLVPMVHFGPLLGWKQAGRR